LSTYREIWINREGSERPTSLGRKVGSHSPGVLFFCPFVLNFTPRVEEPDPKCKNARCQLISPKQAAAVRVISVNLGLPRTVHWQGKTISTAIFKTPVSDRITLRRPNLDGDSKADLAVHGGPNRTVYAYPAQLHVLAASISGQCGAVRYLHRPNAPIEAGEILRRVAVKFEPLTVDA